MRTSGRRIAAMAMAAAVLAAGSAAAQGEAWAPSQPARAEDVRTLDGIVGAFYEVISGPAGQPRQWARDSTLYLPGLRFTSVGTANLGGSPAGPLGAESVTHAQFAALVDSAVVSQGFYEREVERKVSRHGRIAHVWSSYEYRATPDGPVLGGGVNSLQLVWDGERWWIAHAMWDEVEPGTAPQPASER